MTIPTKPPDPDPAQGPHRCWCGQELRLYLGQLGPDGGAPPVYAAGLADMLAWLTGDRPIAHDVQVLSERHLWALAQDGACRGLESEGR